MKKTGKTRLVQIDWSDSCMWASKWDEIAEVVEDHRKNGLDKMKTVGYLLDETKDYVLVCQSLHFNRGEDTVSRGCEFFTIPKGCITKMINL